MNPPNYVYSSVLGSGGLLCLLLAAVIWRRRSLPRSSRALRMLLLVLAWWDLGYALFWAGAPEPFPNFWIKFTATGALFVPIAVLVFSSRFSLAAPPTGLSRFAARWTTFPRASILLVEPLAFTLSVWIGPWPWGNSYISRSLVYWLHIVYSYLLMFVGAALVSIAMKNFHGVFKRQAAMLLFAATIPWAANLLSVLGIDPIPGADITPFAFTVTSLIFVYALFRYRLLDVVPIARHLLVEYMKDGVIVTDDQGRVVDINPTARQFLNLDRPVLGEPAEELLAHCGNLLLELQSRREANLEVTLSGSSDDSPLRCLDVSITPLVDANSNFAGHLLLLRDITALKLAHAELHRLATSDALTQLANRRYFMEQAQLDLERSIRYQHHMALVMIDIDYFKNFNDRYGHPIGDQALIFFARICQEQMRKNDLIARIGGEEFMMLLPETNDQEAYCAAERVRLAVEASSFQAGGETASFTISMGIASLQGGGDSLEKMIRRADQSLYQAKQEGRNRVVCESTPPAREEKR